jgi:hypothetical protein
MSLLANENEYAAKKRSGRVPIPMKKDNRMGRGRRRDRG